jgi:hypothetical protein
MLFLIYKDGIRYLCSLWNDQTNDEKKSRVRRQCGERGEGDVRGRRELERGRVLELLDQ